MAIGGGRMNTCLTVLAVLATISVTAIFVPSVFYESRKASSELVVLQERWEMARFDSRLSDLRRDLSKAEKDVKAVRKQFPWTGRPTRALQNQYDDVSEHAESIRGSLVALEAERENALSAMRGLSPIFSELAFTEARELWKKRQKQHATISFKVWIFDLLFTAGARDENAAAQIFYRVLQLVWRLTMGSIVAFVDYSISLFWYIREYDLYPEGDSTIIRTPIDDGSYSDDGNDDNDDDSYSRLKAREEDLDAQKTWIGWFKSWIPRPRAIAFWVVALCGGMGGTFVAIAVVWGIFIGIIYALVKVAKAARDRERQEMAARRAGAAGGAAPAPVR